MKGLKWKNLKIGFKYGVALSITIILFLVATGYTTISLINIKDSIAVIENAGERAVIITQMSYLLKAKNSVISKYILYPSSTLLEEYDSYEKEFLELQTKIEPEMNTEALEFLFDMITNNNEEANKMFEDSIIAEVKKNNTKAAMGIEGKVSALNKASFQLSGKLRTKVNDERNKSIDSAYGTLDNTINTLIISILVSILTGTIIIVLISRSISRNLSKIVNALNRVSKGDLTVEKINYNGQDEIGELSTATDHMQYNLRNIIGEVTTSSFEVKNQGKALNQIAWEVKEGGEQIATTMEEMASGAEQQASSSDEIANSIIRLTELIEQASKSSMALENSSKGILDATYKGNGQMEFSIGKMKEIDNIFKDSVIKVKQLEKNSDNITKLVQVINDISEQSNLLALNATIEAARAGEAGKGFAVVADEIRKLAEQSGNSVNEITNIVLGIQSESRSMAESLEEGYHQVETGTEQIKVTGQAFKEINDEVADMVNKIKDISQNINYISEDGNSVNKASEEIAAISQENSAGIEETVASIEHQNGSMETITENAKSLSNLAERLNEVITHFKL